MGQKTEPEEELGEDEDEERKKRETTSWEGGPLAAAAAGCRNVSHACPLHDLASLECGRYWE